MLLIYLKNSGFKDQHRDVIRLRNAFRKRVQTSHHHMQFVMERFQNEVRGIERFQQTFFAEQLMAAVDRLTPSV